MFIRGQSLYGTKVHTVTKFIRGQSLYNFFHTALKVKKMMDIHLQVEMYGGGGEGREYNPGYRLDRIIHGEYPCTCEDVPGERGYV